MRQSNEPINPIIDYEIIPGAVQGKYAYKSEGLTKREYFAGIAMEALISRRNPGLKDNIEQIAILAVDFADALIKQLNFPAHRSFE